MVGVLPPVTEELQEAARTTLARLAGKMLPADRKWLGGAVQTLLLHFYSKDLPDWQYAALAKDWIAVLEAYPDWAVDQARREWLRDNRTKPVPADIVKLCRKAVSKDRALQVACRKMLEAKLPPPTPSPEARAESAARVTEMLRLAGVAVRQVDA